MRFDLGAHMPSLRLEVSGWAWSTEPASSFREDPGRNIRETTVVFHFLHSCFWLFFSENLIWAACRAGAQALKRFTVHTQAPGQAGRQAVHAQPQNRRALFAPTRARGDWLPRDTSMRVPKRPQAESRGVLQKLRAASTPPHPHVFHATKETASVRGVLG